MKKVRVFSTLMCPYCTALKSFLKENDVSFEEVDIAKDEKAKEEMVEKTGQMGVPVIDIGGEFIAGFEKEKICQLLNLKN